MAGAAVLGAFAPYPAWAEYLGETGAIVVTPSGCNASSLFQIPGSVDLFMGRHLLTADGRLSGVSGPNDCSGGDPRNKAKGLAFNRWGLTLEKLDWRTHAFSVVKAILDTSIDPSTGKSAAVVTAGAMKGAIIRSAYDAQAATFEGQIVTAYECVLENGGLFHVDGTSLCLSVYDPGKQEIDLARTTVVVSGVHHDGKFIAAAVPALLVLCDKLYLYWSALTQAGDAFETIEVRTAELEDKGGRFEVVGGADGPVRSDDEARTAPIWSPRAGDPTRENMTDIRAVWTHGSTIVAMASVGGRGCAKPRDHSPGCFRLDIVKSQTAQGAHAFESAQTVADEELPTNPQEYTRPVRDPDGKYWFLGHYFRPRSDALSQARPAPGGGFWKQHPDMVDVMAMYPLTDATLLPTP